MMSGLLSRFKKGLAKTRAGMFGRIRDAIRRRPSLDEDTLEEIEEILIQADVGVDATLRIVDRLREKFKESSGADDLEGQVQQLLEQEVLEILQPDGGLTGVTEDQATPPRVILVVGVNGVGKTTTIGKLATRLSAQGNRVLLAACDTFRAGAIDQLAIWAERADAEIVRHKPGADAASVAFDALSAAQARNIDVVLIDTAGRLHTKVNLMEELKKIRRVLSKNQNGAPHETLLVLDATTWPECSGPGKPVPQRHRIDRPGPGQIGRDSQGRRGDRHRVTASSACAICRPRGGPGRSGRLRPRSLCSRPVRIPGSGAVTICNYDSMLPHSPH